LRIDDAASLQDDCVGGDGADHLPVMADEDASQVAGLLQSHDQVKDFKLRGGVQRAGGFV